MNDRQNALFPRLAWPTLILVLALLIAGALHLVQERGRDDSEAARAAANRELDLLTSLVANDLRLGNYQHVGEMLEDWGRNNPEIIALRLLAENGYLISEYRHPGLSGDALALSRPIEYGYSGKATLYLDRDMGQVLENKAELLRHLALAMALVAVLLVILTRLLIRKRREAMTLREQGERLEQTHAALKVSESRLQRALLGANDGLWDWDVNSEQVYYSPRWKAMLGYGEDELEDTISAWRQLVAPEDAERAMAMVQDVLAGRLEGFEMEQTLRHKDGHPVHVLIRGQLQRDENGKPWRLTGTQVDISDIKKARQQLDYLAHHDTLTALPNRQLFNELLDHAVRLAHRSGDTFALLFLDLDHFKNVNDSLGHKVGDQLLVEAARRLHSELRDHDVLARIGGDEFLILLDEIHEPGEASHIAQRLIDAMAQPFLFDDQTLYIGASIGISVYPQDGRHTDELQQNADAALYQAKRAGRGTYRFFSRELAQAAQERLALETLLRQALDGKQLELHYQPQVDLRTGKLLGMEALARWQHPSLGAISPARFIPLAEETGLITQLGDWALRTACGRMRRWLDEADAGECPDYVAVNVSSAQFGRGDLFASVAHALADSGIPPERLELEITESFVMTDPEKAVAKLNQIRALGVRLAIDDFGTGYSSLAYLKRLPVQRLKVDQGFVRDMLTDANDEAIVRAVIALGQSLSLDVLAEGVETEAHAKRLIDLGCHAAQGWHYGRPAAAG